MNVSVRAIAIVLTLLPGAAFAQTGDLIVEKKTFELPSYTTVAGATIKIGEDRLGIGGHAQRRQVERDPDHALLHRHQPRVR